MTERGNYRHYGQWQAPALPGRSTPVISGGTKSTANMAVCSWPFDSCEGDLVSEGLVVIPGTSGSFVESLCFGGTGAD